MSQNNNTWNTLYDDEPDFYASDYTPRKKYNNEILRSPQSIYNYLNERVFGQTEYKKAISVFVYKALKGITSEKVILIASESGSGKSFLISELAKVVPNMVCGDSSAITASGYKGGTHVTTILNRVDTSGTSPCFVVLDEFNRLLQKGLNGWSETSLLSELFVLFDDKDVSVNAGTEDKPFWVNPQNIFWVLLGSFSNLTDVKVNNPIGFNSGISMTNATNHTQITKEEILKTLEEWPELVGRISRIIVNKNMSEANYLAMLKDKKYSPISKLEQELGLSINIAPKKIQQYAREAFESGTGFRGIKNSVLEIVDSVIFESPDAKEVYIK